MNVFKPMENNTLAPNQEITYDFIIAGAGCAGLSLLYEILNAPLLKNKKILVIDKSLQKSNDRTWCFWEANLGPFESLVCKKWDRISIHKKSFFKELATAPFSYKMIQGIDFYNFVINFAKKCKNVFWQEATITNIDAEKITQHKHSLVYGIVKWEGGLAKGHKVFSSILPFENLYALSQTKLKLPFLWQHFKGHLIEFETPEFDDRIARLMDFNVDQQGATGFMYLLPLSSRKALVEYTLFSKSILHPDAYTLEINNYIGKHYPNKTFQILHEEIGAIPMTRQSLAQSEPPIYVIGTLGNAVKASTGYAFQFIQAQVKQIVHQLTQGDKINTEIHQTRHQFYDAVLLYILHHQLMEGSEIFKRIFEKNKAEIIFKFLSNTSTLWEDFKIMSSLPTPVFLPAAFKVVFKRLV